MVTRLTADGLTDVGIVSAGPVAIEAAAHIWRCTGAEHTGVAAFGYAIVGRDRFVATQTAAHLGIATDAVVTLLAAMWFAMNAAAICHYEALMTAADVGRRTTCIDATLRLTAGRTAMRR